MTALKKQWITALFLAVCIGVTGCGGQKSEEGNRKPPEAIRKENQEVVEPTSTETKEQVGKQTTYPLSIITYDSSGNEIETIYKEQPQKVLAVYQGSIETMLALGLEEHMIGAAGLDNEVPEEQKAAFSKVNYLDEFTPSLETVTMLEPDMILSWGSFFGEKTLGDSKKWAEKGINPYINTNTHVAKEGKPYARTLENEYTDILNLGKIFNVQDKAESIVATMKETIETVKNQVKAEDKEQKVLILEWNEHQFINYNENSLGGDMVTQLGGTIGSKKDSLGKEELLTINPDVIFVVYMPYEGDNEQEVKQNNLDKIVKDKALQSLVAVQENRVVPIKLSEMYASATRTQDGIVSFAKGLYGAIEIGEKNE